MIRGFRDQDTQRFFAGEQVKAFQGFADRAVRRLTLLDNADSLQDLRLPGCGWERVPGDPDSHLSIRINEQWRIRTYWTKGVGPGDAAIVSWTPAREGTERLFARNGMRPVHPGEILREQLEALGLSANALSRELGAPVNRITMIMRGERGMSADSALRLTRYFGTSMLFWLNLQKTWELRRAEIAVGAEIIERVKPRPLGPHSALVRPDRRG